MTSLEDFKKHGWYMALVLEEAERAFKKDEVPVGAIVVDSSGKVLSRAHNEKEGCSNPCGHAEVLAIQRAALEIKNWRLSDCSLYCNLEPCLMCFASLIQCRIKSLYFGAYDPKGGAISLGYLFQNDKRLNHRFDVVGGLNHFECSNMLSEFFKRKRKSYNQKT